MRLGQTLVVILITPVLMVLAPLMELRDTIKLIQEIWSEEL